MKSTYGFIIYHRGNVVAFGSKKQRIVSLSSTESEFIGITEGVKASIFVRSILEFMNNEEQGAKIEVRNDNVGAIQLLTNSRSGPSRTRHIHRRFLFVRQLIEENELWTRYIASEELTADMMTKSLGRHQLLIHRRRVVKSKDRERVGVGNP